MSSCLFVPSVVEPGVDESAIYVVVAFVPELEEDLYGSVGEGGDSEVYFSFLSVSADVVDSGVEFLDGCWHGAT